MIQSRILQHVRTFEAQHQLRGSESIYVFQANRLLTPYEVSSIQAQMDSFTNTWSSHEEKVLAHSLILGGYFLVFVVATQQTSLSGCAKDKLTHCIQALQARYNVSFLDRYALAFIHQNKIEIIPYQQLSYALAQQLLTKDSLYFDYSVTTFNDLNNKWMIPIKESWLASKCVPTSIKEPS